MARYTSSFTPSTTAFKDDKDTVLLLHMDGGGGIDPATNLPTLPGQGNYFWNASVDAIFYDSEGVPTNKSLIEFDGSDYLATSVSDDWDFSGEFTIETWVRFNSFSAAQNEIIGTANNTAYLGASKGGWILAYYSSGGSGTRVNFSYQLSSSWIFENEFDVDDLSLGMWYNFTITRDSSDDIRFFLNGVLQDSVINNTTSIDSTEGVLWIGAGYNTTTKALDGYLDQVRITDTARYDLNFTPPTVAFSNDSYTKLLMHMDGSNDGTTFTDSSGSAHTVTPNGNVHTDTAVKKIGTASAQFDGTGDYLTVPDSSDWDILGSDFTIECWVKPNSVRGGGTQATTWDYSFAQHFEDASNRWVFAHGWNGDPGSPNTGLYFGVLSGGSWLVSPSIPAGNTGEFTTTDWHHCAVTGTAAGISGPPAPDVLTKITALKTKIQENQHLSQYHTIENNSRE